jgi:hypothetical protein
LESRAYPNSSQAPHQAEWPVPGITHNMGKSHFLQWAVHWGWWNIGKQILTLFSSHRVGTVPKLLKKCGCLMLWVMELNLALHALPCSEHLFKATYCVSDHFQWDLSLFFLHVGNVLLQSSFMW